MKILSLLLSITAIWSDIALSETFEPAKFLPGKSPTDLIRYPKRSDDQAILVLCAGRVSIKGRFIGLVVCDRNPALKAHDKFVRAVVDKEDSLRLSPATVDGEPVEVWLNFSVLFNKVDGAPSIRTFPNHLLSRETYGPNYSAPQRYALGNRDPCVAGIYYITVDVDSQGRGSNPGIIIAANSPDCSHERMAEESFIPATYNGESVAARYREIFFTLNEELRGGRGEHRVMGHLRN